MKPLSNKFNVLLLIFTIVLLVYFLFALLTIFMGIRQFVGKLYRLYISIVTLWLTTTRIAFSIMERIKWESHPKNLKWC